MLKLVPETVTAAVQPLEYNLDSFPPPPSVEAAVVIAGFAAVVVAAA